MILNLHSIIHCSFYLIFSNLILKLTSYMLIYKVIDMEKNNKTLNIFLQYLDYSLYVYYLNFIFIIIKQKNNYTYL